jgi:hypothetical protein
MTNVYMYADETGNLDYNAGGSKFFGIGTATWLADPAQHLWQGERMRFGHAANGVECSRGYHAKDDSKTTRAEVYNVIKAQAPRIDTTFLEKSRAYANVRAAGPAYLYKLAWYLHFKEIARQVTSPGDTLYVAVATLGTAARKTAFKQAIDNVCAQVRPRLRDVVVAHWESASCWGLQVADYGLWAVQRQVERGDSSWMWAVPRLWRACSAPGRRLVLGKLKTGYPGRPRRGPLDFLSPANISTGDRQPRVKYLDSKTTSDSGSPTDSHGRRRKSRPRSQAARPVAGTVTV